ncbi:hypothetical protein [Pseudanabaena mucicola]|uniref:Uncharacterized protein n=1 Tax=Pseudanabaena mucicola FACHB-723 TaxID=2692860 RepID=A0ABR8A1N8_9CYAN|nr:hypothetical protein [Pseudanabaena mucicola]MBD2189466.1 hypothetical protein [Pseudanabaena mucicola FACHB-723]
MIELKSINLIFAIANLDVFCDSSIDTVEAIKGKSFTREEVAIILN